MASQNKQDVEILLQSVTWNAIGRKVDGKRLLNARLLWPRALVASRESVLSLAFHKGAAQLSGRPWHEQIVFKERVEHRFALQLQITELLSDTRMTEAIRYFLGDMAHLAGKAAEDAWGTAGAIAAIPLEFARKKFREAVKADVVAEGTVSLDTMDITDGMAIAIPLLSCHDITQSIAAGKGSRKKILLHRGEPIATALCEFHRLG